MPNQDTGETKRPVVLLRADLERPGRYAGRARVFQFAPRESSVGCLIPQPALASRARNRCRGLLAHLQKLFLPTDCSRSGLPAALSIEPAASIQRRPKRRRRLV